MKASDLRLYLATMIRAKKNVMVTGNPGTGKTAIEALAAEDAKAENFLMYASIGNPTDFKGFPYLIPDSTNPKAMFIPFGEQAMVYDAIAAGKLVAVFLDDLGQGAPATQAACMSFIDKLQGRCAVIAASNHRGHTGVQGVLEPIKSRFNAIVELVPDLEDFINHLIQQGQAKYGLTEEAILDGASFLRFRPDLFCLYQPTADLTNSPCSRTWVAALQTVSLGLPTGIETEAINGAIGEGTGGEFGAFKRMRRELPPLDAFFNDPKHAPISSKSNIRWAVCVGLAAKATVANFPAIHIYAERLYEANHAPFAALLIKDCTQRKPEIMETAEFEKLACSNTIGALIAGR